MLAYWRLAAHSVPWISLPLEHRRVTFQVNEGFMQSMFDLISTYVKSVTVTQEHAADEVIKITQGNQYLSGFIYPHCCFFFFLNKLVFVPT